MNKIEWLGCLASISLGSYGWLHGKDIFYIVSAFLVAAILICAYILWALYDAHRTKL